MMRGMCAAVALVLSAQIGLAEEPKANELQAVRAAVESYVSAFNRGDAEALAEHWAEDAEYLLPSGEEVRGREAIREVFEKLFAGGGPKIDVSQLRIRLVSKDVALEEGQVRVVEPDKSFEDSRYLAVHIRRGKSWKLHTVRETSLPPPQERAGGEHLKALEWLVGTWSEESSHGPTESRFAWSKNRTFLTCNFKVALPDGTELEGTQAIGWDPESHVIRSWMFDSDGGFGEGLWTLSEKSLSVKFVQVLPDGRRASATNVYTRIDDDTFEWKSIGRKVDGQFAPNIGPVRIRRNAETPAK